MSSLYLNLQTDKSHTSYQLTIRLEQDKQMVIGKLGEYFFPQGFYIYSGSALKNMESRLKRHCSDYKTLRWHIDYFLNDPFARITDIKTFHKSECLLNAQTPGRILVKKFGAGDCKNHCGSHFKFLGQRYSSTPVE